MIDRQTLRSNIPLIASVVLAGFLCFYKLGYGSFGAGDQTIHARVVMETLQTGDYLYPSYKGGPYYNKPPFKLWLNMLTVGTLGSSNLYFRIWDGLSGFCTLLLMYFFTARVYRSAAVGFVAVFALCSASFFFYGHGCRNGVQDSMMLMFMSIATVLGWNFIEESRKSDFSNQRLWRLSIAGGLAVGLGFITKSVPAYYALVILGLFSFFSGDALVLLKNHWGKLLTIFLLSILPMAVFLFVREDRDMVIHMLFNVEIVKRATNGFNFKREKLFYYNIIFKYGQFVAPIALTWGLGIALYQSFRERSRISLFALIWGIVPVLIQSAAKAKAEWYIMPALPGMALLTAGGFNFLVQWWERNRRSLLPPLLMSAILIPMILQVTDLAEYTIYKNNKNHAEVTTSSLKSEQRRLGRPLRIVGYDMPRLADHEILYWGLVSGNPVILSFDHLKEELLSSTPPDIILTRTRSERQIRDILPPTSSADFQARDKRRRRLVVLSYLKNFTPNLLDPKRVPTKKDDD